MAGPSSPSALRGEEVPAVAGGRADGDRPPRGKAPEGEAEATVGGDTATSSSRSSTVMSTGLRSNSIFVTRAPYAGHSQEQSPVRAAIVRVPASHFANAVLRGSGESVSAGPSRRLVSTWVRGRNRSAGPLLDFRDLPHSVTPTVDQQRREERAGRARLKSPAMLGTASGSCLRTASNDDGRREFCVGLEWITKETRRRRGARSGRQVQPAVVSALGDSVGRMFRRAPDIDTGRAGRNFRAWPRVVVQAGGGVDRSGIHRSCPGEVARHGSRCAYPARCR